MQLIALKEDDLRLRVKCAPVTRPQLRLREQQVEIDALVDYVTGRGNKGVGEPQDKNAQSVVGLSANQIGLMKQICVVDMSIGHKGYHDLHVLINPQIVWRSKATVEKNEGCVNFPTIRGFTRRSRSVQVEGLDRSGNQIAIKVSGWAAVLLQHEIDHLNGRLFIDRLIDTTQADLVEPGEYKSYRRQKDSWTKKIDVSKRAMVEPR